MNGTNSKHIENMWEVLESDAVSLCDGIMRSHSLTDCKFLEYTLSQFGLKPLPNAKMSYLGSEVIVVSLNAVGRFSMGYLKLNSGNGELILEVMSSSSIFSQRLNLSSYLKKK